MTNEGQAWFEDLRAFAEKRREAIPIAELSNLAPFEAAQCRIIGSTLLSWLQEDGPFFLKERETLDFERCLEKDPFIVFSSDQPGLTAARDIIDVSSTRIVYLHRNDFDSWMRDRPDDDFKWHVHLWSYFCPFEADSSGKEVGYELADGESFVLHEVGHMCGPLFGQGCGHLWKWDGDELTILEEAFMEWVS